MKSFFKYLFNPSFWLMDYSYSRTLDEIILKGIVENEITIVHGNVMIGGLSLWVGNYPYDYGTSNGARPSRSTIELLQAHVFNLRMEATQ